MKLIRKKNQFNPIRLDHLLAETEPKKKFWTPLDGVTQSMIAEWLSCKERARLGYKEGWTSERVSNSLTFGTLCHTVLEKCYGYLTQNIQDWKLDNIIENTCTDFKKQIVEERLWTPEDEENLQINLGYMNALLPAYWRKYLKVDAKKKYLAVEKEFSNGWNNRIPLRGKIDVVYTFNDEVWVMDHKTKSILNDETETRLSFDLQGLFYSLNWWLETNRLPNGFIQNIIQRPRLRKGQDETLKHFIDRVEKDVDDTYFKRIQMTIKKDEFDRWLKSEFTPIMDELLGWAGDLLPNYRNAAACETRFGCCRFIKVCGMKNFDGLFKRKMPFMELA